MAPDQWQKVSELYHAVLEAEPSQRGALLDSADPEVRSEVESLLSASGSESSPLERDVLSHAGALLDDATETQVELGKGATLGHYEIQSLLGRGGMGEVYLAHDRKLGRDVAIKVLPRDVNEDPERLSRFRREARVLASLNHPNIAAIHGLEESAGVNFLILELVDGETLAQRLKRTGPVPVEEALRLINQVADALEAAHRQGIMHRDIKPANIKITSEGRVKVLDFGLAKVLRTDASVRAASAGLDTGSGRILGTPRYMSPEQARGQEVDRRTDIWAFGCVLYELLTGRPALSGETISDIIAAILQCEPDYDALPRATPLQIRRVIQQCLVKDLDKRTQQIAEARRGIEEAQEHPRRRVLTRRRLVIAAAATVVAAVPVTFYVGGLRGRWFAGGSRSQSIAVLPLANLSGNPDQEYFSEGMTESLINNLAKIGALKVISRTSVMTYKGTKKALRQIAEELGVDAVLEGSASRSGDRIRITANLIDAKTEQSLWAESYDRDSADVLVLQSEVARMVAYQVRARLSPQEQMRLASARPVNPEAHNAYLHGTFLSHRTTRPNLDEALRFYELALEKDPNYALAHTGIAWVWLARQQLGQATAQEAGPKVDAAAERALALDSGLAEVHYTMGLMKAWVRWDFPGAETSFRHAIELNSNYPDARVFYARLLLLLKRPAEAIPQLERALELDPHNTLFRVVYAQGLNSTGRHDAAIDQSRQVLAVEPDHPQAEGALQSAFLSKGLLKEAIEVSIRRSAKRRDSEVAQVLQRNSEAGKYREAAHAVSEIIETRWRDGTYPRGIVMYYSMAGLPDKVVEFLEWAIERHDAGLLESIRAATRHFPQLENNPRYRAILRRVGLP